MPLTTEEQARWLRHCTLHNARALDKPFAVEIEGRPMTLATDGYGIILGPRLEGLELRDPLTHPDTPSGVGAEDLRKLASELLAPPERDLGVVELKRLLAWCDGPGPAWLERCPDCQDTEHVRCPDCEGTGGHVIAEDEAEFCAKCDGEGVIGCAACRKAPYNAPARPSLGKLGGEFFNRERLYRLLYGLPDSRVALGFQRRYSATLLRVAGYDWTVGTMIIAPENLDLPDVPELEL